jgi:hypothetical protein
LSAAAVLADLLVVDRAAVEVADEFSHKVLLR